MNETDDIFIARTQWRYDPARPIFLPDDRQYLVLRPWTCSSSDLSLEYHNAPDLIWLQNIFIEYNQWITLIFINQWTFATSKQSLYFNNSVSEVDVRDLNSFKSNLALVQFNCPNMLMINISHVLVQLIINPRYATFYHVGK